MKKRQFFSLLLTCCMTLTMVPPAARALEEEVTVTIGTGIRETPTAEVSVHWDDGWFAVDAAEYRHELAVTAMVLSAAAYVRTWKGAAVQDTLKALGFDQLKSYNYEFSEQSREQAAYTFAVKTVKDRDNNPVNLVAVIVRGTGVYTEWAGNLNVGSGSEHAGFANARDELMRNLKKYLPEANITGKTKFFVTGHSRGGAVSNLTAARLMDSKYAEKQDVYAYTFAAPAVSTKAQTEGYENIFNIIKEDDLVTQVPLVKWGYCRWGVDRPLPTTDDENYDTQFAAMSEQYTALTGNLYAAYQDTTTVEQLTGTLYQLAPTVSGPNMAMLSALLRGDFEELSTLIEGNALAALLMGRTAIRASSELTPLLQTEGAGLASAHCMAGYYSWLTACPDA